MQPMSVAAKPPSGLRPPGDLAATRRSGQFTCYKTGQIYLLLTEKNRYFICRQGIGEIKGSFRGAVMGLPSGNAIVENSLGCYAFFLFTNCLISTGQGDKKMESLSCLGVGINSVRLPKGEL